MPLFITLFLSFFVSANPSTEALREVNKQLRTALRLLTEGEVAVAGTNGLEKYSRHKPQVTIGVLGDTGNGAMILQQALAKVAEKEYVQSEFAKYDLNAASIQLWDSPSQLEHVPVETSYKLFDIWAAPDNADIWKNMFNGGTSIEGGTGDGVILVVSAAGYDPVDGITTKTEQLIIAASFAGLKAMVIFINDCDMADDALLELLEMELREKMNLVGMNGDDAPVECGSAERALNGEETGEYAIIDLLDSIDAFFWDLDKHEDAVFLMNIEDVFSVQGEQTTTVAGRIQRGIVNADDEVELIGMNNGKSTAKVVGLEIFDHYMDEGKPGENVRVILSGIDKSEIERGQVVVVPGNYGVYTEFQAAVYILSSQEGAPKDSYTIDNLNPQIIIRGAEIAGVITLIDGSQTLFPGDNQVRVTLTAPISVVMTMGFGIREGGELIGFGNVDYIYD